MLDMSPSADPHCGSQCSNVDHLYRGQHVDGTTGNCMAHSNSNRWVICAVRQTFVRSVLCRPDPQFGSALVLWHVFSLQFQKTKSYLVCWSTHHSIEHISPWGAEGWKLFLPVSVHPCTPVGLMYSWIRVEISLARPQKINFRPVFIHGPTNMFRALKVFTCSASYILIYEK